MDSIKEYWEKFKIICRNENTVFGFPAVVFALWAIIGKSIFAILALAVWFLVITLNTHETE